MQRPCPLCNQTAAANDVVTREGVRLDSLAYSCERCGRFTLDQLTELRVRSEAFSDERRILRGLVMRASSHATPLEITSENLDTLIEAAPVPQSPVRLRDSILLEVAKFSKGQGTFYAPMPVSPDLHVRLLIRTRKDLTAAISGLRGDGLLAIDLAIDDDPQQISLTTRGWERVEELRSTEVAGWQAFVAIWFSSTLDNAYEAGIEPALRATGYTPFRVDRHEHVGRIDDVIEGEIRRSGLIVADFTGQRQSVYYEAGLALGLGKPVVWCCSQVEIDAVHFDVRQYNFITWSTPDELHAKLEARIRARFPTRPGL
jgi:hypothetical protein